MNILDAREYRSKHIEKLRKENPHKTVCILKTNVVGSNKNPIYMRFICRYFREIVINTFKDKLIDMGHTPSLDGDYCFFVMDAKGLLVKERMVEIEESTPLGRLIDIDVYNEKNFSRNDLEIEMRKCLICDGYAHFCSRDKTHSEEEIKEKMLEIIQDFLAEQLTTIAVRAIFNELELYPKYGLVSNIDSGCHTDMNYETFVKSALTIKKYITRYIYEGFNETIDYKKLIKIGLKAEKRMFEATNNVNTHKGLVFLLGLFMPAVSNAIIYDLDIEDLQKTITEISKNIIGNYYENIKEKSNPSNSDLIFMKYGIKGVREEALSGLSIIYEIPEFKNHSDDNKYHEYLLHLMAKLDDTTIIHKNDYQVLKEVQEDMKQVINSGGYINNKQKISHISKQYKLRNISPGGSADMLVIKIIYEEIKHLIEKGEA